MAHMSTEPRDHRSIARRYLFHTFSIHAPTSHATNASDHHSDCARLLVSAALQLSVGIKLRLIGRRDRGPIACRDRRWAGEGELGCPRQSRRCRHAVATAVRSSYSPSCASHSRSASRDAVGSGMRLKRHAAGVGGRRPVQADHSGADEPAREHTARGGRAHRACAVLASAARPRLC